MQFLSGKQLSYEDVFLVPRESDVDSRFSVDVTPGPSLWATIPIVVANMNAVAGRRMSETVARRGGITVLPQDMDIEKIARTVRFVKSRHPIFDTPVTLSPDDTLHMALTLIDKRAYNAVIIVDEKRRPVGIFTKKDGLRYDRFTPLKHLMRRDVLTISDAETPENMFGYLHAHRLSLAPVVNRDGVLLGVMTKDGAVRSSLYQPAMNSRGEFVTAVAIGINRPLRETISRLLGIGVDMIVLDTAHGHQRRMMEKIRETRALVGAKFPIVAGNVVTAQGTRDLITAGASIVKVGVGPGAMCTTRMMTGVGRPQFSSVLECASVARTFGAGVWADGGIRSPRDVALALAAGASHAMIGSWFAGTFESVGDVEYDEHGRPYKENFGMASRRAVDLRADTDAIFARAKRRYFEEGISTSRMYLKESEKSVEDIIDKIIAGLRSACAYTGARNLREFRDRAIFGIQTASGYAEGKPVSERW